MLLIAVSEIMVIYFCDFLEWLNSYIKLLMHLSYFCDFSMVGVPGLSHICYNGYKEIELPTDLNIVTKHSDTVALDSMVKFEF